MTNDATALVEAFNLKAAIEFLQKNTKASKEAQTDMPPRSEEELDAVTIDNQVYTIRYSLYDQRSKFVYFD